MPQSNARPISADNPLVGHYRYRRHKGALWEPAVIFEHEGQLVCRVADRMEDPFELWTYLAGNRVSKAEATYAFENGGRWPGDAPLAPEGHNAPPSDDPLENLQRRLESEQARVEAWIKEPREGQTAANQAANWLADLRALEGEVTAAFESEKEPIRKKATAIDVRWRPLKSTAEAIKKAMDQCYQTIARKEKARLQAIADAKAKEEAEARRKAQEAEREAQAKLAAEHNIPVDLPPPEPELPLAMVKAEPVKVAYGGAAGPKIAVRKVPLQAVVEDWAKAAVYYSNHEKLREVITKLATHDARDGRRDIPGVKIIAGD